jgi:hypothetical protein
MFGFSEVYKGNIHECVKQRLHASLRSNFGKLLTASDQWYEPHERKARHLCLQQSSNRFELHNESFPESKKLTNLWQCVQETESSDSLYSEYLQKALFFLEAT